MDRVERTVETERLRSALLTSISHDLKTPLAAVLGAAGTLRDFRAEARRRGEGRPAGDDHRRVRAAQPLHRQPARHDQARIRRDRAQRRAARPRRDRRQRAAARAAASWRGTTSSSSSLPDLPMLELDAVLFEQVLFNLLDNAAKYAPPETTIRIQGWRDGDSVCLQVLDEGERHPAGRSRAHLRQVLSRAEGRPGARRHRARARHLARLRRGDARHHRRGKPHRPQRRRVHHQPADPAAKRQRLDAAA